MSKINIIFQSNLCVNNFIEGMYKIVNKFISQVINQFVWNSQDDRVFLLRITKLWNEKV